MESLFLTWTCPGSLVSLAVMRAAVRWVLWDVKDTLLRVRTSVGEQYCQEAERVGLKLSPPEVQLAFQQSYRHFSSKYPNYGVSQGMNGRSWWIGLVRDTFSRCRVEDPLLIDTMAQNLYHNFCSAETWEVLDNDKYPIFLSYLQNGFYSICFQGVS